MLCPEYKAALIASGGDYKRRINEGAAECDTEKCGKWNHSLKQCGLIEREKK